MEETHTFRLNEGEAAAGVEAQDRDSPLQSPSSSSGDNSYTFPDDGETVGELNTSVQDLLSRHRGGPSPLPKKRDRAFSPPSDADSPKRRSLTESPAEAGKFLVRAARSSHRNVLTTIYGLNEDPVDTETTDLMAMIRQTETSAADDLDDTEQRPVAPPRRRRSRPGGPAGDLLISQVTAELVKKFESGKEPEEKKARSSESLAVKTDALHDPDDLDSSHVDLQDDLDPSEAHISLHESDSEKLVDSDLYEVSADNLDLDSSGSVNQFNLMKSESFPDANLLANTLSLADELQQAGVCHQPNESESESLSEADTTKDHPQEEVTKSDDEDQETHLQEKQQETEEKMNLKSPGELVGDTSPPPALRVESGAEPELETEEATAGPSPQHPESAECGLEDAGETPDVAGDEVTKVPEVPEAEARVQAEQESSPDGADLDFSVLQSAQQLNVDVTKQRVTLRQKGSLARRRKPTRTSIRSLKSPEVALFTDSTERRRSPSPESDKEEEEAGRREQLVVREQVARSCSMPERPAPQPRPAPVLLPGLSDHIKRRTKVAVPLPRPSEQTNPPAEPTPPPWMSEMKVRRGPKLPKPELDRTPSEARNPESPSWMRDVMNKKKRAVEILERRASVQPVETEQPAVPPWMKELRRTPRPIPAPISHSTNNNGPSKEATPIPDTSERVSNLNDSNASRQETPRTPFGNVNSSETRSKGREVLAPIKRSSVDNSAQQSMIDNRLATPSYLGTSNGQVSEITPNKNALPPLKTTSQSSASQDNQENSESPVPAWRKEIAARRKSKTFVPLQKAETPLKLGDMPAWKRELAERNKIKKRDSIDIPPVSSSPTPPSIGSSPGLIPWQQELAQRRKRTPSIPRQSTIESSPNSKDDVPSWARNVERRRARLADCGLIENSLDEKSG